MVGLFCTPRQWLGHWHLTNHRDRGRDTPPSLVPTLQAPKQNIRASYLGSVPILIPTGVRKWKIVNHETSH